MCEILKTQFDSGKALVQNKHHSLVRSDLFAPFMPHLYPLLQPYYHEFNPFFTFNVHNDALYCFTSTFFVRDGAATFGDFILKNHLSIPKWGTVFIIPHEFAPLVPSELTAHFLCWKIHQHKSIELKHAKKVIVFGFLIDQYLGNMQKIEERLNQLKHISPDTEVAVYLPLRSAPFLKHQSENYLGLTIMGLIKDILPGRKIGILDTHETLAQNDFEGTYLFELNADNFIVADSYLNYFVARRGGTVEALTSALPEVPLFELDLSFHHKLCILPFPKVQSAFSEIFFLKKRYSGRELLFEPAYHDKVRALTSTGPRI